MTLSYATADSSATAASSDYAAASGTLTFAPGTTTQTITVLVNGDTAVEGTESFLVNFFNFTKDTPDILKLAMNPDVTVRARGVMEKCTYCTQRINRAKIDAKLAGRALRDGDVKTACQQACPAAAIEFGDIRDTSTRVAKAKADPRNYALLDELNTRPRTTYLTKVRNPNPALEGEGTV